MAGTDRHELVEAARVRAGSTVTDLWLRHLSIGGNGDLFDVDAYLCGLLPLKALEQDVLAVAGNERLEELYRAARVPLATPSPASTPADTLRGIVAALLHSTDSRSTTPLPSSDDAALTPDPRPANRREPSRTT